MQTFRYFFAGVEASKMRDGSRDTAYRVTLSSVNQEQTDWDFPAGRRVFIRDDACVPLRTRHTNSCWGVWVRWGRPRGLDSFPPVANGSMYARENRRFFTTVRHCESSSGPRNLCNCNEVGPEDVHGNWRSSLAYLRSRRFPSSSSVPLPASTTHPLSGCHFSLYLELVFTLFIGLWTKMVWDLYRFILIRISLYSINWKHPSLCSVNWVHFSLYSVNWIHSLLYPINCVQFSLYLIKWDPFNYIPH